MKRNAYAHEAAHRALSKMVLPAVAALDRLADRWLQQRLRAHDISLADFRIVGILLGEHAGLRQRELAARLGIRPATISAALPCLERKGLIERFGDPNDARVTFVRLRASDKGLAPVIAIIGELDQLLFGDISAGERAWLKGVIAVAAQRIESPPFPQE